MAFLITLCNIAMFIKSLYSNDNNDIDIQEEVPIITTSYVHKIFYA